MSEERPAQLGYAPGSSLATRVGVRRLILGVLLLAGVVAILVWKDPVARRVNQWAAERRFLALQRQCMAYAAPAERVVYEEDPAEAAALAAADPQYLPISVVDAANFAIARPGWQPPVRRVEPLWSAYAGGVRPIGWDPGAVAFMGERTTPSGERRLVSVPIAVQAQRTRGRWSINRWLHAYSFASGSLVSADRAPPSGLMLIDSDAPRRPGDTDPLTADLARPFTPPFPLRLYAGQPDASDPARFSIPYALQGRRGVITGVLHDDGGVILTPDIGWHGRLDTTVSWTPRLPAASSTGPAPAR